MEVVRIADETSRPAGRYDRGDRLEALYRSHAADAVRLAYLLTGDASAAQDVAHDAFVRVGSKLWGLKNPEQSRAYLYKTTVNLCRGRFRRARTERAATERIGPRPPEGPPDTEGRDEMWHALMRVPLRQRSALFLRYYEDLSEAQTADALGCSISAVKSLVNRGLKDLRSQLRGADHG